MAGAKTSPTGRPAGKWLAFLLTGVLSLVLGVVAIAGPHVFTFAVNFLLGGLLLIIGLSETVRTLANPHHKGGGWGLAISALYLLGGLFLLFDPFAGALALTLVLALAFLAKGLCVIVYGLRLRPLRSWNWLVLSGAASILVAFLIWMGWPATATWAIGLLAGIELVLFGASLVMVALAAHASKRG